MHWEQNPSKTRRRIKLRNSQARASFCLFYVIYVKISLFSVSLPGKFWREKRRLIWLCFMFDQEGRHGWSEKKKNENEKKRWRERMVNAVKIERENAVPCGGRRVDVWEWWFSIFESVFSLFSKYFYLKIY
jgi:hypothetical protein